MAISANGSLTGFSTTPRCRARSCEMGDCRTRFPSTDLLSLLEAHTCARGHESSSESGMPNSCLPFVMRPMLSSCGL